MTLQQPANGHCTELVTSIPISHILQHNSNCIIYNTKTKDQAHADIIKIFHFFS
jgi:hypothetical protein